jgi:hypothetical protein
VIIDAPPLDPVPDAAAVARWADGLILVTRYGRTRREELADAAAVLKRKQADLLGVVLNRVPRAVARSRGFRHPYPADADRGAEPGAAGRRTGAGEAGDDDARHAPGSAVARAAQPELP